MGSKFKAYTLVDLFFVKSKRDSLKLQVTDWGNTYNGSTKKDLMSDPLRSNSILVQL